MKRWAKRIGVLLAVGVMINVAVAWCCALWLDESRGARTAGLSSRQAPGWYVTEVSRMGACRVQGVPLSGGRTVGPAYASRLPAWSRFREPPGSNGATMQVDDARGWPLPALWTAVDLYQDPAVSSMVRPDLAHGVALSPRSTGQTRLAAWQVRALPLRPIWTGFTLNTIFFAAMLCLPFGTGVIRRYLRRRRGACIECGYDLRAAGDCCPECGAYVQPTAEG